MTDWSGLIESLRELSRYQHSDYSIAEEAAEAIESLVVERDKLRDEKDRLLALHNEMAARDGRRNGSV